MALLLGISAELAACAAAEGAATHLVLKQNVQVELTYSDGISSAFAQRRGVEISKQIWADYCQEYSVCESSDRFTISLFYKGDSTMKNEYCIGTVEAEHPTVPNHGDSYACGMSGKVSRDYFEGHPF